MLRWDTDKNIRYPTLAEDKQIIHPYPHPRYNHLHRTVP